MRNAVIVADAVVVLCPHCEAEQPSPDNGADTWLPAQIRAHEGSRTCVACDEKFRLNVVTRAHVITPSLVPS